MDTGKQTIYLFQYINPHQLTATHCNSATNCNLFRRINTLQHTATSSCIPTHCNTLPNIWSSLHHTTIQCTTLQRLPPHKHDCNTLQQDTATPCNLVGRINMLRYSTTHCTALEHTATNCNTPLPTYQRRVMRVGVWQVQQTFPDPCLQSSEI